MSYQVLYRRFRPQTFSEVVGQEHITSILKNQIISGQIAHAYLFSGSKGTGKTSTAKIFARAVNCLTPKNGEPCGTCAYCRGLKENGLTDILEIDAASNRGIDEIRDLKDKVNYMPAAGRFRVYIIDEVHMLTQEAFNALLKTLEEPPEHIIFIFATTEPHKLLPTILSRCQRFDFARLTQEVITERLKFVLSEVGAAADEDALACIAQNSDGALRDALSFLDKALTTAEGGRVTRRDVEDALGLAGGSEITAIAEAVVEENIDGAFTALDEIIQKGSDVGNVINQLLDYFRALMIFSNTQNPERILGKNEGYFSSLQKCSANLPAELQIAYVRELSKVKSEGRYLPNPRYLLECCLLLLSDRSRVFDSYALTARVQRLEKKLEGLKNAAPAAIPQPAAPPEETPDFAPPRETTQSPLPKKKSPLPPKEQTLPETDKATLQKIQKEVLFAGKFIHNRDRDIILGDLYEQMKTAAFDGHTVYLYPTGNAVHMMDIFESKNGRQKLAEILSDQLGTPVEVEITNARPAKKKDLIQQAEEILGGLTELED